MKEYAGKILMAVEGLFPQDRRVYMEALKLARNNYKISVICLSTDTQKKSEKWNDISVYRIPRLIFFSKVEKTSRYDTPRSMTLLKSIIGYSAEYFYFTVASFFLSIIIFFKEGFDVIHAHNPPDTIFLWALFYKMFGKKFVFDHHDLSPEMYLARYKKKKDIVYRCLLLAEKFTCLLADRIIATNNSYREIDIRRNEATPEKVYVVRNAPDFNRVYLRSPDQKLKGMNKTIIGYVGMMNPQDGVDYLIRALSYLNRDLGRNDFLAILMGKGDDLTNLRELVRELGLTAHVLLTGYVPDEDMLKYLSTADICAAPDPRNDFTDHSTWIKIMEYMALAKPIVAFDLKETRYSAQDAALYATPNNEMEFARALERLMDDVKLRQRMGSRGRKRIAEELDWEHVSSNLLEVYKSIFQSYGV